MELLDLSNADVSSIRGRGTLVNGPMRVGLLADPEAQSIQ
jgi:hypothetical protein